MSNMKIQYAFTIGPDHLADQARLLTESIKKYSGHPFEITAFLPNEDEEKIPNEKIKYFEENVDLVRGEFPEPDYPFSGKWAALEAAEQVDADWYVLLDSDTVLLAPLDFLEDEQEGLYLCPAHGGWSYWAREDSFQDWKTIYEHFGLDFPGMTMTSVIDETPIPPFWNGGVIISSRPLADQWTSRTKEIRDQFETGYFSEQVSLATIGHEQGVNNLSAEINYPSYMFLRTPPNAHILHYKSQWFLGRILNPKIRKKLSQIEMQSEYTDHLPAPKAILKGLTIRLIREIKWKRWRFLNRRI